LDFKPFKIGKYLLLERIATGGMAEVYRAKASGAGGFEKQLAIKRILPSYSANEEFRRMFEYEARLSSMLTHSNIVQIYDFVKSGETYLLAMEYVDGKNLRQLVNKAKKAGITPPIEFGLYIMNEVCKGLEYAHKKKDDLNGRPLNIIHRDMSPQNIMMSYDGAVKIVDFGIAKAKDRVDETRSGVIKGKFGYMSPEQANGEQVDHRTDIFSTGIILYELMTHKRLFAAENDMATLKQIQECVIVPASKLNPKVTPELEKIILKGLTKDLRLRYNDAGLFHRNLQEYLNKHFPTFTQKEAGDMISRIFKEEINQEKKRFEAIHRQSIPFSQGESKEPSGGEMEEVVEALEGSLTKSEVGSKSSVTFVSQHGVGIPTELELPGSQENEATNPGASTTDNSVGEPLVLEENDVSQGSKSIRRRESSLSDLVISNQATGKNTRTENTKVTGEDDLFRDEKMQVLNNGNTPTPTQGGTGKSGITLARNTRTNAGQTNSQTKAGQTNSGQATNGKTNEGSLTPIRLSNTDPSIPSGIRRRERSISAVTKMGSINNSDPGAGPRRNTNTSEVSLMSVTDAPAVRAVKEGMARAEATGSYHRQDFPEREEYFPTAPRRNPFFRILVFCMLVGGVAYLYRVYLGGVPADWMRVLAGIKNVASPSPEIPETVIPETESQLPVERKPGGDCVLKVDTDPQGAKILIGGEERGTSSAQIPLPCNESINLTLRLDGYESITENLAMTNRTEKVVKSLRRIPSGTIEFTFNRNARVIVDGVFVGQADANKKFEVSVRAGKDHSFVFENKIFNLRQERTIAVKPDTITRLKISLEDSAPPRAPTRKR